MTARAVPDSRLVLGSVQFGLDYGITNRAGVPDDEELSAILRLAADAGIRWIDTARGYGDAEERLGALGAARDHRIVTKIQPLARLMEDMGLDDARAATESSLKRSLAALDTDFVDVIMLHHADDATRPGVLDILLAARQDGTVGAIGVSIYTPAEGGRWLAEPAVTHIQLPCNPLDTRWCDADFLTARRERRDVTIHARSAFLQGLLLAPADRWPDWVAEAGEIVGLIEAAAAPLAGGRVELCLRYHRTLPWIDASVVGVASSAELRDIVVAARPDPLSADTTALLRQAAALAPPRLLDPRLW